MLRNSRLLLIISLFLGLLSQAEVPELSCPDVKNNSQNWKLVDVRTPEEYVGELGHIAGAELVTLGPQLTAYLEKQSPKEKIIFICRSGSRSIKAVKQSQSLGLENTVSMRGGMLEWNRLGYPTQK